MTFTNDNKNSSMIYIPLVGMQVGVIYDEMNDQ